MLRARGGERRHPRPLAGPPRRRGPQAPLAPGPRGERSTMNERAREDSAGGDQTRGDPSDAPDGDHITLPEPQHFSREPGVHPPPHDPGGRGVAAAGRQGNPGDRRPGQGVHHVDESGVGNDRLRRHPHRCSCTHAFVRHRVSTTARVAMAAESTFHHGRGPLAVALDELVPASSTPRRGPVQWWSRGCD